MSARYAIYYTPAPDSALERLGGAWFLGNPLVESISSGRHKEITASARHYGFHATLKAPFALAEGTTPDKLDNALDSYARGRGPVTDLHLKVSRLDGFIALIPASPLEPLQSLAADCVRIFDSFRAPLSESDLARRRKAPLSERQDALLQQWGYPYVLDTFRFHMTLTCRLDEPEFSKVEASLRNHFAPLDDIPVAIDAITLCCQESRTSPFKVLQRYPFAGAASSSIATNASTDRDSGPSLTTDSTSSPSTR